ncbi:MAG: AsmA family protein, partial [Chitinivibrionia bacterium]|nr:AsmA family protein [Chitinivibrionia bacterium]
MKKFIIAGIVLLVIAAVVIVALANLNGIINRNKDFILSKAEQAIGRPVSIEHIGVTLRGGIGVELQGVKIADDPAFSNEPFLEAADLRVNAKLWPLFSKRFEVKRAALHAPVIRIVRNEQGVLNSSTIGAPANTGKSSEREGGGSATAAAPLAVALVDIDEGTVHYDDRQAKTALSVARIKSRVEDFNYARPVAFELEAAVFSPERNVRIKGDFGPASGRLSPETIPIRADIEVERIDLALVQAALPQFASRMPAGLTIAGPVGARIHAEGVLPALRMTGSIDGTALSAKHLDMFEKPAGLPLTADFSAHRAGDSIIIDRAGLVLNKTALSGSGEILAGETPKYVLTVSAEGADVASLASLVPKARAYEPGGSAALDIRIEGAAGSGAPPSLHGTAALRNGGLKAPQLAKP